MEPEASLSWLALTMTPGVAARLLARLLKEFGSIGTSRRLHRTDRHPIRRMAATSFSARQNVCFLYPQTLLQIHDPPGVPCMCAAMQAS